MTNNEIWDILNSYTEALYAEREKEKNKNLPNRARWHALSEAFEHLCLALEVLEAELDYESKD